VWGTCLQRVLKNTDKAYTNSWFVIFIGCVNIEAYFIKRLSIDKLAYLEQTNP
jgi:hypothetical protein